MRSRRDFFRGALGASTALLSASTTPSSALMAVERGGRSPLVRDRLWIFTAVAGGDDHYLRAGGIPKGSRMTPAEGAFYLGVPNLILIRDKGQPAVDQFEQYALSFRPLTRVVWSVVGGGGRREGDEVPPVLALAEKFPNVTGVFLDDFFVAAKKGEYRERTGAYSPSQLKELRQRARVSGRRLETWVTFYTRVFDPSHPSYFKTDLPLASYLDEFDVITMWTRGGNRLERLESYLDQLQKVSPKPHKALGCDFYDYLNKAEVPIRLMEHQCNLGLKWLREGRIREMIFLANTVMDVGLEVVEWTRQWIASVADQRVVS